MHSIIIRWMRATCEIIVAAYERDRTIIFRQQVEITEILLDLLIVLVVVAAAAFICIFTLSRSKPNQKQ